MNFTTTHQRGFTLIELMIATTLGLAIVLVATAGFRVAAQAVTKCNRMALENALVRTAVLQACNEVDYWTYVDNPETPSAIPSSMSLRQPSPFGGWKPLAPFPVAGVVGGLFVIPGDERQSTWNPSPMAWAAHDPRAWCRGNMAETLRTDLRYGDYNLVANDQSLTNATSYDPFRCRSWYDNQLKTALDSLGFYGTLEYLPSNVLFVYHGSQPFTANPGGLNSGFMPNAIISGGTRGWLGMTFQQFSTGRFRTTDAGAIPFANDKPIFSSTSNTNDPFRSSWTVGYGGYTIGAANAPKEAANFHLATAFGGDLLTQHPQHWQHVAVKVQRFIRQSRAVNICIIDITDPITGHTSTIPFSTRGTTLRGARLQRTNIAGQSWSTYDNTDPLHPIIGASLDYPAAITY